MKFIFGVVFLCIGAVAAQAPAPGQQTRLLAEALEKRGEALLTRVKAELEKLRHEGHWHLASALDHQEVIVEALVLTLKAQLANKDFLHNIHHIHVIEEDLLHLENEIADELRVIENVRQHQHQGHNQSQLVEKAESLIKQAQEALAHHGHLPEARGIQHEVAFIEALLKEIKARPSPDPKDEQALAKHEQSLQVLLEKAANRGGHHGHNGF